MTYFKYNMFSYTIKVMFMTFNLPIKYTEKSICKFKSNLCVYLLLYCNENKVIKIISYYQNTNNIID